MDYVKLAETALAEKRTDSQCELSEKSEISPPEKWDDTESVRRVNMTVGNHVINDWTTFDAIYARIAEARRRRDIHAFKAALADVEAHAGNLFADAVRRLPGPGETIVYQPDSPHADFKWEGGCEVTASRPDKWTPEELKLVNWFLDTMDDLPRETYQDEINIAGLDMHVGYGPGARDAGKLISDLRLLKADPVGFHHELKQRYFDELARWEGPARRSR